MTTIRIKLPKISQVEFSILAEQDDIEVRGNALASGNDQEDKEVEDDIISKLNRGNVWAWASVNVKASYKGMEGNDYLGCCSYDSESDFINNSCYYEDMKKAAYNDLIAQIKALA